MRILNTVSAILILLVLALLVITQAAGAQTIAGNTYQWTLTPGGAAPAAINLRVATPPGIYTIDAVVIGTAPTACSYEVDGSPDGTHYNSGAGSITGTRTCSATLDTSTWTKPVAFLRPAFTVTGGDATTQVLIFYTRGSNGAAR